MLKFENTEENREYVIDLLKEYTLCLMFTREDESERILYGTRNYEVIGEVENKSSRKHNPEVLPVWDTQLKEWRSFRWDRLHTIATVTSAKELGLR